MCVVLVDCISDVCSAGGLSDVCGAGGLYCVVLVD